MNHLNSSDSEHTYLEPHPLAAILFIFGALNAYSALRSYKRNTQAFFQKRIEIFSSLMLRLFIIIGIGTTLLEGLEILETNWHY